MPDLYEMMQEYVDLVPQDVLPRIPSTAEARKVFIQENLIAHIMLHLDGTRWYIAGYNPETEECYGLTVDGDDQRFGHFSLHDLRLERGCMGWCVNRDLDWVPKPLGECK